MKSLTLIITLLLITYSFSQTATAYALTACEVENEATTKTTAVITYTADKNIQDLTFKDDYLKLEGDTEINKKKKCNIRNMYKYMSR